jgi:hypothetical protein
MPVTYEKIADYTVPAGGQTTFSFTSIPNTYTDLLIKISARKVESGGGTNLQMRFNSATTGYTQRAIIATNPSPDIPVTYYDASEIGFMYVCDGSQTAGAFNSTDIYIPNYLGSQPKSVGVENQTMTMSDSGGQVFGNFMWNSSAAITSIYFQIGNGTQTFAQYSNLILYGILRA